MSESLSNSDILRNERASFSNVRMPLQREDDLAGGELPFVVAVLDDLSGNAPSPATPDGKRLPLEQRQFDKVSRNTLNHKMKELSPGLEYDVKSTLPASLSGGEQLHVKLRFNSLEDFDPGRVAQQIDPLRKLLKLREQMLSLKARAASDPELKRQLEQFIKDVTSEG